ncbi:MAG: HAD-IA family hydrolase [Oscillospiraceae bacterium]|nr:HAD-IA family hydrolase [Oscillospiraceae bacterium]
MGYQTVLFDMDGTVLDTLYDLWASTNAVLRELGYPERTPDEIRGYVGNGARNQLRRALPEGSGDAAVDEALLRYQAYYAEHCRDHTKPYDGVVPMLERLQKEGKQLAVVSNKPDQMVKILSKEHFGTLLHVSIGETPERRRKPAPDTVYAALEALGAEASKDGAVYVGDSEVDVETAKNAGLPLIAVSWGFRGRAALEAAGAETVVDAPEELTKLILG